MTRINKPTGLIRYSSQDAMAGKPRKLLRPRTVLYPLVLVVLLTGLVTALVTKAPADVTVLRGLGAPFTEEADGRIANQIRIKITNRRGTSEQYTMTVSGLAGTDLKPQDITVVAPENPLVVAGGATRLTSVFILLPRSAFTAGERHVDLVFTDGRGYAETDGYRLLGPATGGAR
jgi:polyferredoxin